MKTISLREGLTLDRLLEEAASGDVVFLTVDGEVRFALVAVDEGDQEICALRSNADFMAYLSACEERARTRSRKSLQQIRELYGGGTDLPDGSNQGPD